MTGNHGLGQRQLCVGNEDFDQARGHAAASYPAGFVAS
jgi:hypothetical protein